jgi:2,3-bisphosphoglycerate-dependent phosphoglycerate mutase
MTNLIEITFLRHGRSLADDEGKHEGRYDSPLTAVGRAQAEARARGWLAEGITFNRAVASPLQRAAETARIVTGQLGVPLALDPAWMEVNNGCLAGLTYEEGNRLYPRPAFRSPYEPMAETGENEVELQTRAALALNSIVRAGPGRVLVVAHGGILNAALRCLMGAPAPINRAGIWFQFGDLGYAKTRYDPSCAVWTLLALSA